MITHTVTGRGFTEPSAKATRGWSDEEWAAGVDDLRTRGLLDADGLTDAGVEVRAAVEAATDRLAEGPWLLLGDEGPTGSTELGRALSRQVDSLAGAFPAGMLRRPPLS